MGINFEYYRTFYYVAKCKKISLAAEKLYISQPAVTQTIQKLEEQIGEPLFIRNKSGMELTESGKTLFTFVSESLETLENAESRIGSHLNLQEGSVKIRTGSNVAKILLYDALEKFSKDYPNIKVEIATGAPATSIKMLHTGEIDLVMFYMPYNVSYSNIEIKKCCNNNFVFAMSKKYYEENNVDIKNLEDLNKYSLIIPKRDSTVGSIFMESFGNKIKNFHFEIAQEQMKKEFIMRNLGIGYIIKDEIESEIENGEVIVIDNKDMQVEGGIGIATLKDEYASIATRKLVEYIFDNLNN